MPPILNNIRVSLIALMSQQLGRNSSNFDDVVHFVTLLKFSMILRTGIEFTKTTRYKMAVALQHGGRLVTINIKTTRNLLNCLCMKLFKTGIDVVKECLSCFAIDLPSCVCKKGRISSYHVTVPQ